MNSFAILGLQQAADGSGIAVARVRMFINNLITDEDFALPDLPPGVSPSEEYYAHALTDSINTRMTELSVT